MAIALSLYFRANRKTMKALTMQKIVIIGAGRVAVNLSNSIQRKGYQIIEVCNRSESAGRYLAVKLNAKYVRKPERVSPDAGLYIIAVSDSAIPSIAERLRTGDHMVVHTSGSADMEVLEGGIIKLRSHISSSDIYIQKDANFTGCASLHLSQFYGEHCPPQIFRIFTVK